MTIGLIVIKSHFVAAFSEITLMAHVSVLMLDTDILCRESRYTFSTLQKAA